MVPLVGMRVPVPSTVGAEVMEVALAMAAVADASALLTSEEAADLLKISTRTLQRMRKDKTIPYMMVRSKCRYRLTDLEECVRRKIVHCNPKTLEEFKHNYLMTRKEADDGRDW